ncbi:MAG: hypothetical protein FAF05_05860 [Epsilonproteobacteria bacterium]|nr:hypothetical protein [Campylobacterota bacterium]
MCIPHGAVATKDNGYIKEDKPKKHIEKPSEQMMKEGDPDFVDERTKPYKPKKKSFFGSLFSD